LVNGVGASTGPASGWVGWAQNAAGVWYSNEHGFGRVNAGAAVTLAKTWTLVNNQTGLSTSVVTVNQAIVDNSIIPITSTTTVTSGTAGLPVKIEHVTLYVTISHQYMGDLRITLTSPSGTVAIFMQGALLTNGVTVFTAYPLPARLFCKSLWHQSDNK
jgi:hypothetical protein